MKKSLYLFCIFILFTAVSCIKDEQSYTTFTGDMVYSFLQKDTTYSEFVRILDEAGLKGMLSAYGQYTCLAPTNGAMRKYYAEQGTNFTFDSLREGQIDTLAKTHITANRYHSYELTNGVIPTMNMSYQLIEVQFDTLSGGIRFNGTSRIVLKDKDVYNGVVHGIDRTLKFMSTQLPYVLKNNPELSIFTQALFLTHLSDSLLPIRDMTNYPPKVYYMYTLNSGSVVYSPIRKFGYTAFVEDNHLLKANGIQNLQDLIERAGQLYPSESKYATDYTNRNNSLNKYMSYHLVNKAIYTNTFFYKRNAVKGYTPDEFLETMLSNRIIRVSNVSSQTTLNVGSNFTACVKEADNQRSVNGVYHLLDGMLVYSETVERMLQNTRIRFDVSSLFPELTNNNIRGTEGQNPNSNAPGYYFGFDSGYLKNITFTEQSQLYYASGIEVASNIFPNFQTDIFEISGDYDITIKLLPVPPGTYELRFGYHVSSGGNLTQIYVDNKPYGIPFPIWTKLDNKVIGSISDELTDDNGVKTDRMLHYKGYMKAPESFMVNSDGLDARQAPYVIRKIVGVFTLTDHQPHSIRFKSIVSVKGSPFELDYFEWVPKSVYAPPGEGDYESRG